MEPVRFGVKWKAQRQIFSDAVKQAVDVEDKVSLIKELYVPKDNPIMMFNAVNIFQQ